MENNCKNFFNDLPHEMNVEILSLVGSTSSNDVFQAKRACKRLLAASEDDLVYKRLCLDRFPLFAHPNNPGQRYVIDRCLEVGNPTSICRKGFFGYFSNVPQPDLEQALMCLKNAASQGQHEACYMYGLILLASEDQESKCTGLRLLNQTFSSKLSMVEETRENISWNYLRSIWLREPLPLQEFAETECDEVGHTGYYVKGWPVKEPKPECLKCFWYSELKTFRRFGRGYY